MFELNLSLAELEKRTSKECFKEYPLLKPDSKEYLSLSDNERTVLGSLLSIAKLIESVHFKLENEKNEEFIKFLDEEIKKGNRQAELSARLFYAQKSMFSPDREGKQIKLVKNLSKPIAGAFFPTDLTSKKLGAILSKMLDDGKVDMVKKILSANTIVRYNGKELIAFQYEEYFPEFIEIAQILQSTAQICQDISFKSYLIALANYFEHPTPKNLASADKLWVKSSYILEFCITRESYDDGLTPQIILNKKLYQRLSDLGVCVNAKDSLGVRLGIVNKKGTDLIKQLDKLTEIAKQNMPYADCYEDSNPQSVKLFQAQQDVDIVCLSGDEGAYRAGVVLAQNLPNNDKICANTFQMRKNVYHRQFRSVVNMSTIKAKISSQQMNLYSSEAEHIATICHENTHSLGPRNKNCGEYTAILEEFKADLGAIAFLNEYEQSGILSSLQVKQIIVSNLSGNFLKAMPDLLQAHRVRSVMYSNILLQEGALCLDDEEKIIFNFKKVIEVSKKILAKIIKLQLNEDVKGAREFVTKYFVWSNEMEKIAKRVKKEDKILNGYVKQYIF